MTGVQTCALPIFNDFDFNTYVRALTDFCNEDLSAFFFDIRKDSLYCDAADDPKRRAYRTVLDTLFHALVRYAAPVLVFTAEEVWGTRFPDSGSVHLLEWPDVPAADFDMAKWDTLRSARVQVNEAIEPFRRDKVIGSGLEAAIEFRTIPPIAARLEGIDLSEVFITSSVRLSSKEPDNAMVSISRTTHHKCGRCWRHLPEVASDGALCSRCDQVVAGKDPGA